MRKPYIDLARAAAIALATAGLLSGCSLITSTTDAIAESVHATTDATSSTSHSFDSDEAHARTVQFVKSDIDAIRADAARGHGEEISTLAYLLDEPDAAEFGRWMQRHYVELFVGLKTPEQLLTRIDHIRHKMYTASANGVSR
ncbi:MAG: DUF3015 domain-containing protein [Nitrococcus sp.]|nr:DUF3015 domain-containing protein [Nitrococcus sp.]